VFAKHNDRALELYVRLRRPIDGQRYACAFYRTRMNPEPLSEETA
jgi:hypothetical protein